MVEKLAALPEPVARRLEELKTTLVEKLGDDLEAMLVHGSAVRGGYRSGTSDVDVVLVLRRDPEDKLEAIGPALQLARYSARIEAMLLSSGDVRGASDVFPLLYDDIARCHVCLHGKSPFADMRTTPEHRRLRVEQELRELRIRMRRAATDMPPGLQLAGAVERKLKQARSALRALLALRGVEVDDQLDAVVAAAADRYGMDAAPLRRTREDGRAAFTALARLLDAAIVDVEALDPATAATAEDA